MKRPFNLFVTAIALLATAAPAHAGMPQITLSDVAGARLETISYFLLLVLLLSLFVLGS